MTVETIDLLGVSVAILHDKAELMAEVRRRAPVRLAFANANLLVLAHDRAHLRAALKEFLVVNDGVGVDVAFKLVAARRFPANLNGTDFTPYFLEHMPPLRVFLYGARPEVAKAAAGKLARRFPQHAFVGWEHGYIDAGSAAVLPERIASLGADVVLVALGNPRQELWLHEQFARTGARFGLAIGAYLDFVTGKVIRAPRAVQAMHLEWLFRLGQEPRRLLRRYTVEMGRFLWLAARQARTNGQGGGEA